MNETNKDSQNSFLEKQKNQIDNMTKDIKTK